MSQAAALVFARCIGFVARAPGFSHPSVPVPVRAAFAFVLALGLTPLVAPHAGLAGASFLVALVVELAVGFAIGFAASLLYEGASAGGQLLDQYVGVQISNPLAQSGTGQGFTQLWGLSFLAVFFLLDGYQVIVLALADSLHGMPPGGIVNGLHLYAFALSLPALVLKAAALVAAPAIALGLITNIALGAIARVVPRFTNFTLTYPVVFAVVLIASLATLPGVVTQGAHPWLFLPTGPASR